MKKHIESRIIGELKTNGKYEDSFQTQILFEGWLRHFPHVHELYLKNLCELEFGQNRILVRAKFTDREWTMWCLKHSTPVARQWVGA